MKMLFLVLKHHSQHFICTFLASIFSFYRKKNVFPNVLNCLIYYLCPQLELFTEKNVFQNVLYYLIYYLCPQLELQFHESK